MEAFIIAAIAIVAIGLLTWLASRTHWVAAEDKMRYTCRACGRGGLRNYEICPVCQHLGEE